MSTLNPIIYGGGGGGLPPIAPSDSLTYEDKTIQDVDYSILTKIDFSNNTARELTIPTYNGSKRVAISLSLLNDSTNFKNGFVTTLGFLDNPIIYKTSSYYDDYDVPVIILSNITKVIIPSIEGFTILHQNKISSTGYGYLSLSMADIQTADGFILSGIRRGMFPNNSPLKQKYFPTLLQNATVLTNRYSGGAPTYELGNNNKFPSKITLNFVNNFSGAYSDIISNCNSLEEVTIKGGNSIFIQNTGFLRNNQLLNFVDLQDCSLIDTGEKSIDNNPRLETLLLRSEVMISIINKALGSSNSSNYKIYVPNHLVEDYKGYSKFNDLVNRITPISEYMLNGKTGTYTSASLSTLTLTLNTVQFNDNEPLDIYSASEGWIDYEDSNMNVNRLTINQDGTITDGQTTYIKQN